MVVTVFEVKRCELDLVAVREKQDPPRKAAAFEDWPMLPPLQLCPVPDMPCVVRLCDGLELRIGGYEFSHHGINYGEG